MTKRPAATDLRGGRTPEVSFTILTANLVVAYTVDFQSDLLSDTALGSTVGFEDSGRLLWFLPTKGGARSEMVWGSVTRKVGLDSPLGIRLSPYRLTLDREGSRDWALAKLSHQFEDLELILWNVGRPGQLRLGFRWSQPRSWLCFVFDDAFSVYRGALATS